jgi:hypothetical protein
MRRGPGNQDNPLWSGNESGRLYLWTHGETDWIVNDREVNFAEIWAQFDTLLMGRRTYEAAVAR